MSRRQLNGGGIVKVLFCHAYDHAELKGFLKLIYFSNKNNQPLYRDFFFFA